MEEIPANRTGNKRKAEEEAEGAEENHDASVEGEGAPEQHPVRDDGDTQASEAVAAKDLEAPATNRENDDGNNDDDDGQDSSNRNEEATSQATAASSERKSRRSIKKPQAFDEIQAASSGPKRPRKTARVQRHQEVAVVPVGTTTTIATTQSSTPEEIVSSPAAPAPLATASAVVVAEISAPSQPAATGGGTTAPAPKKRNYRRNNAVSTTTSSSSGVPATSTAGSGNRPTSTGPSPSSSHRSMQKRIHTGAEVMEDLFSQEMRALGNQEAYPLEELMKLAGRVAAESARSKVENRGVDWGEIAAEFPNWSPESCKLIFFEIAMSWTRSGALFQRGIEIARRASDEELVQLIADRFLQNDWYLSPSSKPPTLSSRLVEKIAARASPVTSAEGTTEAEGAPTSSPPPPLDESSKAGFSLWAAQVLLSHPEVETSKLRHLWSTTLDESERTNFVTLAAQVQRVRALVD